MSSKQNWFIYYICFQLEIVLFKSIPSIKVNFLIIAHSDYQISFLIPQNLKNLSLLIPFYSIQCLRLISHSISNSSFCITTAKHVFIIGMPINALYFHCLLPILYFSISVPNVKQFDALVLRTCEYLELIKSIELSLIDCIIMSQQS